LAAVILEIPADPFRTEIPGTAFPGFIAYLPPGSIARAKHGQRRSVREDGAMRALSRRDVDRPGEVPRLAGVAPLYVARQLYDITTWLEPGKAAALMKPVVANLSDDDIIAILLSRRLLRSKDHAAGARRRSVRVT